MSKPQGSVPGGGNEGTRPGDGGAGTPGVGVGDVSLSSPSPCGPQSWNILKASWRSSNSRKLGVGIGVAVGSSIVTGVSLLCSPSGSVKLVGLLPT